MAQASLDARTITIDSLRGSPRRRRKETIIRRLFLGAAVCSIVISTLIVLSLVREAFTFLTAIELSSLWAGLWSPRSGQFDLRVIISGTLLISLIAMLVAGPLGIGAAMYLSEYASPRVRRILKPIVEILAGIPSVVLGYFALLWISPELVQRINPSAGIFNMLAAGIAVGVLVMPLVASVAEDALKSVPMALREASYGLGARRMSTTLRVVTPAAVSGIMAALILGLSRAVGETMVVAIAAGNSPLFSLNVFEGGQTMTGAMAQLAIGGDQVKGDVAAVQSLYFVGLLLFLMTLALNVVSERFVRRVRQRY
ncbi:MAG TPA: phosphate ABC transporter permease subunit PstC [Actinomycetota bacterium]|nr:phosphate ABC transporter permease subunit PstC [Actinomycetota bacterium]